VVELELNYARGIQRDQMSRRRGRDVNRDEQPRPVERNGYEVEAPPPDMGGESFPSLGGSADAGPLRSGRWATGGHRAPQVEDFPSLPGAPQPAPVRPQSDNGARKKQPSQRRREDDFPTLNGPSNASMNQYGPTSRPAITKNIPGLPASWTAAAAAPPTGLSQPQPKDQNKQKKGMVVLVKQSKPGSDEDFPGLEAPKGTKAKRSKPVLEDEFPGLEAPQGDKAKNGAKSILEEDFPGLQANKGAKAKAKVKAEEPQPVIQGANLKAAANLILGIKAKEPKQREVESEWRDAKPAKSAKPAKQQNGLSNGPPAIPGLAFSAAAATEALKAMEVIEPKPVPSRPPPGLEAFPSLGNASKAMSANFRPAVASNGASWTAPKANGAPRTNAGPPPGFGTAPKRPSNVKYNYEKPIDFEARNKNLLRSLTSIMGGKSLEFAHFKQASSQFKAGDISTSEYYDRCLDLVEEESFLRFLPELLALLPDIKKQKVHSASFNTLTTFATCRSSSTSIASGCPRPPYQ